MSASPVARGCTSFHPRRVYIKIVRSEYVAFSVWSVTSHREVVFHLRRRAVATGADMRCLASDIQFGIAALRDEGWNVATELCPPLSMAPHIPRSLNPNGQYV